MIFVYVICCIRRSTGRGTTVVQQAVAAANHFTAAHKL